MQGSVDSKRVAAHVREAPRGDGGSTIPQCRGVLDGLRDPWRSGDGGSGVPSAAAVPEGPSSGSRERLRTDVMRRPADSARGRER